MSGADSIRVATVTDVGHLNALIARSATDLSRPYYTQPQTAALIRYVFGVDTQLISDGTYFMIEHGLELAACGGWSMRRTLFGGDQARERSDTPLDPRVDAARIRAFFVHPEFARRGLGRTLLAHCEQAARTAGFHRAELMATLPGEPFYRAAGYVPLERVELRLPGDVTAPMVKMGRTL
jgi:GNAT superfamily N-acetyltransferase